MEGPVVSNAHEVIVRHLQCKFIRAGRTDRRGGRCGENEKPMSATPKRIRQVGTFTARDSSGKEVPLAIFQEFRDAGTRDDPTAERKGPLQIMTTDGRRVDKIGTGKYRIVGSAQVLTSDDPNAP